MASKNKDESLINEVYILKIYCSIFLTLLMIFPAQLQGGEYYYGGENSFSLGLSHRCFQQEDEHICFTGRKLVYEHNLLHKDKSRIPEYQPINPGNLGSPNLDSLAALGFYILLILFVAFVIPGIIWLIGGLYSSHITTDLYVSSQFLSSEKSPGFHSIGIKTGAYIFRNFDINFYMGVAYSFADGAHEDLEGRSTRFGIGYIPKNKGFIAALEFERHLFREKVGNIFIQNISSSKSLGQSSLLLGWRF